MIGRAAYILRILAGIVAVLADRIDPPGRALPDLPWRDDTMLPWPDRRPTCYHDQRETCW